MTNNLNVKEQEKRDTLSQNITTRMIAKGWTKAELARRAGIGRDSVGTYVKTSAFPGENHLYKLCKALDCTPDELCPGVIELSNMMPEIPFETKSTGDGKLYFRVASVADSETVFGINTLLEKYHEKQKKKKARKSSR